LARTNEEKSIALAKCFFLARPDKDNLWPVQLISTPMHQEHKDLAEQVHNQIKRLKPYKAPGPDGILNIILTKCVDILEDRLVSIYEGIFKCSLTYKPWKSFTTIILCKQVSHSTTSQKHTDLSPC